MINFELVVVETLDEALRVEAARVYRFAIDATECDNCGLLAGPVGGDFFPCALVACVDETEAEGPTVLCLDCISAVLFPGEIDRSPGG
jgi:hypothetical protein